MKTTLTILLLFISFMSISQTMGTDSEGKSIYEFQKSATFTLPISSADNSLKLGYTLKLGKGKQFYIKHSIVPSINAQIQNGTLPASIAPYDTTKATRGYTPSDSTRFTMAKSWGINGTVKVSNLLSNFAKIATFHPKYSLSIGIGRNIDVLNHWGNIVRLKYPFCNYNLTFGMDRDDVKMYDTVTKKPAEYKVEWTRTITANYSLYFPIRDSTLLGFSTVLSYSAGNNLSDLKKFQDNKEIYIDNNITTHSDYIGRYGDLKSQNSFRCSFSVNIFPNSINLKSDTIQLCISPYTSFFGPVNTQLKKLVGVYVNATQGKSIFSKNSVIKPGIGFGIDWVVDKTGFNSISIFVGGSLDIHTLIPHTNSKDSR